MTSLESNVNVLTKKHKRRQIWLRITSVLMCVTVFITTYALILPAVTLDTSDPSVSHINWGGIEWDDVSKQFRNLSVVLQTQRNTTYTLQYSDDLGQTWSDASVTYNNRKPGVFDSYTLVSQSSALDEMFRDAPMSRKYRVRGIGDKNAESKTSSYDFLDLLEVIKPDFRKWLAGDFAEQMGGTKPVTKEEYLAAFDTYYHIPSAQISVSEQASAADSVSASAILLDEEGTLLPSADYHYQWQYYFEGDAENGPGWYGLNGADGAVYTADPSNPAPIPFGGTQVRCIVSNAADDTFVTKSSPVLLNPQQYRFSQTVPLIESTLGLAALPINNGKTLDLTYGSSQWDWLYFEEVAEDPNVPFSDKESLWHFLCKTYLEAYDGEEGSTADKTAAAEAAVQKKWYYYRYDMIDPGAMNTNYGTYYTTGGFADGELAWVKTADGDDSFHYTLPADQSDPNNRLILDLGYGHLENGVDYESFVKDMSKYAEADAAGDGNSERKYTVNLTSDAHAQIKAPIVVIFQIQTSWQLFDLEHANALAGEGKTEVGAVANNTELASFYDIKHAMLDFVDYMGKKYPGNTLVVGVTEVRHGGSDSMFESQITTSTGSTAPLYVSNNPTVLYDAISQWDVFGNCEHVHYDNNTLKLAVANLGVDLGDFRDKNGNKISYDDIRKTVVIIGGPTENKNATNGYGCVLPWSDFASAGIDSVYGIRVNNGTSYAGNTASGTPILSWLDIDDNNTGRYKDANGDAGFTEKFVCTNREMLYNTFLEIVNQEFAEGGIDILDVNANVDNLTMTDTVRKEFQLDCDKPFLIRTTPDLNGFKAINLSANLKNLTFSGDYAGTLTKEEAGSTDTYTLVYNTNPGDSVPHPTQIRVTHNEDGTTKVDVVYNKLFNTQKAEVDFGIQAKADYIGSNNVYTNVGVPSTSYEHFSAALDRSVDYTVVGTDKPQVNVPIEFTTENGTHKTLYRDVDGSVTYDISLNNAQAIPAAVQNLVVKYPQINGTLSYKWVLPDGSEAPVGEVSVVDGKVQGNFPSLGQDFTFTEDGFSRAELSVTFTPNPTDPKGEFHDVKTATAVNEKKRSGVVTFQVLSPDSSEFLTVKKIWVGNGAHPDSISFKLIYEDENGTPHYYQENGADKVFALGEADNWTKTFPISPTSDGNGSVYEYSAVEATVSGYSSSIEFKIDREYEYEAMIDSHFTPQYGNSSGDKVVVFYRYNETDYTAEFSGEVLTENASWDKILAEHLPTKADGTPFPAQITKVEYVSGSFVYTVFKNDIDPYHCEVTQVGYPVFQITPSAEVAKDKVVRVNYKVNGTSYYALYTVPKKISAGGTITVTGTDLFPPNVTITDVSFKVGDKNNQNNTLSGSYTHYVGMRKQFISFTSPIALAKDKTVRITLKNVNNSVTDTYVAEYKVPKDLPAGTKIENYEFPEILPDGEYYLSDLVYVMDANNSTPMTEKTTVTFSNPLSLEKGDVVTVTLSNGMSGSVTVPNGGLAVGASVVVEINGNPPAGTTVSSIMYKHGPNTKPLTAQTQVVVTTPIALAKKTTVTVTIHDGDTNQDITASLILGDNVAADRDISITSFKQGNTDVTLDYTHHYSVTGVTYAPENRSASNLETPGAVTFTVPYKNGTEKINAQKKQITLTVKDGNGQTVSAITGTVEDKKHESGGSVTVTFDGAIPTGEGYTYELSLKIDNQNIFDIPDFSLSSGGTPADAFLTVGGKMPDTALYIGGSVPDNKVTSVAFNTISATMDITEGITFDSGAAHTVNYLDRSTGKIGSYTVVPTVDGTVATFTNGQPIPAGDYEIVSITRSVSSRQLPYYNDLNAYLRTSSMLKNITITSGCDITNTPIVVLPATGGNGTKSFVITGLCLMAISLIGGWILLRRRARNAAKTCDVQ